MKIRLAIALILFPLLLLGQQTGVNGPGVVGGAGGGASPGGSTNSVQINAGGGTLSGVSIGADTVLQGTASTPQAAAVPNCGSATQALAYSTTTHTFACQSLSTGTTSLTATDVGYGSVGNALTGTSDFTWTDASLTLQLNTNNPAANSPVPTITTGAWTIAGPNPGLVIQVGNNSVLGSPGVLTIRGSTGTGGGGGSGGNVVVAGGTTASGSQGVLQLGQSGAPTVQMYGTVAAGYVDASHDSGSFTATTQTSNACSVNQSVTFKWVRSGAMVVLGTANTLSCTSNSVNFWFPSATLPTSIRPAADVAIGMFPATDNGAATEGCLMVQASGAIQLTKTNGSCSSGAGWTSSGTKGWAGGSGAYQLN